MINAFLVNQSEVEENIMRIFELNRNTGMQISCEEYSLVHNRVPRHVCRNAFEHLEQMGKIEKAGEKWQLTNREICVI